MMVLRMFDSSENFEILPNYAWGREELVGQSWGILDMEDFGLG